MMKAPFTVMAFLFASYSIVPAQSVEITMTVERNEDNKTDIYRPQPVRPAPPADPVKIDPLRHLKPLPAAYSGYAIELSVSALPLQRNHPLFRRFGNVHYQLAPEGIYSYCILVQFSSASSVTEYLRNVVIPYAPDAKALVYKEGRGNYFR